MKLKITQPGFENYSGQMGMILFKDGISVYDVNERDALRLSALFGCKWATGASVTITKWEQEPSAPIGRATYRAEAVEDREIVGGNDGDTQYVDNNSSDIPVKVTRYYTLEELEKIADNKGLKGLREVAKPLGIKGTSINGLIEAIMEVAGKPVEVKEGTEIVEG